MKNIKFKCFDKEQKKWSNTPLDYQIKDIDFYTDYIWCQHVGFNDTENTEPMDIVKRQNDTHLSKFERWVFFTMCYLSTFTLLPSAFFIIPAIEVVQAYENKIELSLAL